MSHGWAGVRTSSTLGRYSSAIRAACANERSCGSARGIALAIPLSVAKNGLRIFVLAMLATRVDRSFLTGRLHHQGGIIYFLIALAVIFLRIWVARRGEEGRSLSAPTCR